MTTLQYSEENVIPLQPHRDSMIAITLQLASGFTPVKGQVVRLLSDGTIQAISAGTQVPFGIALCKNPYDEGGWTVITFLQMKVLGRADGTVTRGGLVRAGGTEAVSGKTLNNYKAAVQGDIVIGVAMTTASDNEEVEIGILQTPYAYQSNLQAAYVAPLGTTSNLVGVDGTGSNAAPLVGTEARLDAIEAKVDAALAALVTAGLMAAS